MVTVDEAIIARLDRNGKHFEVLVDPELAYSLKHGKAVSILKMLAVNDVYSDSKKGEKASSSDVSDAFGTTNIEKVAEDIVKKGDVQLTTDFRKKKAEEKKRQIASFISTYAVNPQTRVPHPIERVLSAMEKSHVNIDPFKPADQQVDEVLVSIKSVIPISLEETSVSIEIPARYSGKAFGMIKSLGKVEDQKWLGDGSLSIKLKFPSGLKDSIYHKINAATGGSARIVEK